MSKIKSLIFAISLITCIKGYTQSSYSLKSEIGFLKYQHRSLRVDPGPNWKGYNLKGDDGFDFNFINGLFIKKRFFAGIGLGYLNFAGVNGMTAYSDFEYLPLKTRLTPLVNMKIGYSHIWNQYKNGTGTALLELGGGLNYRITSNIDIYLKSGLTWTQQSQLFHIRSGIRF